MSQYEKRKVPSGQTVEIRPRTYPEWEEQEYARLEIVEKVPDMVTAGNVQQLEITLQRANIEVRKARLACWVKDFDKVKGTLTLRDIAEIENYALELEAVDIPLGNSGSGGDGLLTESGTPTANSAESATRKGRR